MLITDPVLKALWVSAIALSIGAAFAHGKVRARIKTVHPQVWAEFNDPDFAPSLLYPISASARFGKFLSSKKYRELHDLSLNKLVAVDRAVGLAAGTILLVSFVQTFITIIRLGHA